MIIQTPSQIFLKQWTDVNRQLNEHNFDRDNTHYLFKQNIHAHCRGFGTSLELMEWSQQLDVHIYQWPLPQGTGSYQTGDIYWQNQCIENNDTRKMLHKPRGVKNYQVEFPIG